MGFFEAFAKTAPEAIKTSILVKQEDRKLKAAQEKEARRRWEWGQEYDLQVLKAKDAKQKAKDTLEQKAEIGRAHV